MAWQPQGKQGKKSFLEVAMEGAMTQVVGQMLLGKGGKGTAAGPGGGKGNTKDSKDKQCQWDGCHAAEKKIATRGSGPNCHCCKQPFSSTPPLKHLVNWAWQARLKEAQSNDKGQTQGPQGAKDGGKGKGGAKGAGGKGKGKAAPPDPKAPSDADDLKQAARAAELKAAKEKGNQKSPSQAAAEPFLLSDKEKTAPKPFELRDDLVEATEQMAVDVKKVVDSLHSEKHPSTAPLEAAEATVSRLLPTSSP